MVQNSRWWADSVLIS